MTDATPALDRQATQQLTRWLREHLRGRVTLDVWTRAESGLVRTDRDTCTHCDDVASLMRRIASLHPALQYTHYDLDQHADRAAEAGVERPPTTIVRARGRAVHLVGLFGAALFPSMLDVIRLASAGATPLLASTRSALSTLAAPVEVEAMLAPYDPYSQHVARLLGALAIESRDVHARLIEASEFPVLAAQRALTEVPLITINGRRFTGAWDEQDVVEQITRVAAGNAEPVIRDRVLAAPYYTEEQLRELAAREAQNPGAPPSDEPPGGGSGLIIPGR